MQLNVSKMNGWSSCSSFSVNARTWNWYETLLRAHKEHHDLICINQNVYVKSMYIHVSNLALYRSEYSTWFIALNSLILYVCIMFVCGSVCIYDCYTLFRVARIFFLFFFIENGFGIIVLTIRPTSRSVLVLFAIFKLVSLHHFSIFLYISLSMHLYK